MNHYPELTGLTYSAVDDNVKEIAGQINTKIQTRTNDYIWHLAESGTDWQDYSLLGMIEYFVKMDGENWTETLLIPHLRKQFQSVVEKDFTEEMFQNHLAHIRSQFFLSENFQ